MKAGRALAPLLVLALSACSGPSLPGGGGSQSSSPPAAGNANLSTVQKAYQDLLDNYVDQPDPAVLLSGALRSVQQTLTANGVSAPAVQMPAFGKDPSADWSEFSS